jgi:hypothetical protein
LEKLRFKRCHKKRQESQREDVLRVGVGEEIGASQWEEQKILA